MLQTGDNLLINISVKRHETWGFIQETNVREKENYTFMKIIIVGLDADLHSTNSQVWLF